MNVLRTLRKPMMIKNTDFQRRVRIPSVATLRSAGRARRNRVHPNANRATLEEDDSELGIPRPGGNHGLRLLGPN